MMPKNASRLCEPNVDFSRPVDLGGDGAMLAANQGAVMGFKDAARDPILHRALSVAGALRNHAVPPRKDRVEVEKCKQELATLRGQLNGAGPAGSDAEKHFDTVQSLAAAIADTPTESAVTLFDAALVVAERYLS
jgi:hypothetical protein